MNLLGAHRCGQESQHHQRHYTRLKRPEIDPAPHWARLLTSCWRQFLIVRRLSSTETRYAFRRKEPRRMVTQNDFCTLLALTLAATFITFCQPAAWPKIPKLPPRRPYHQKFRRSPASIPPSWIPRPTHAPISISLRAASSRKSIQFPAICRCTTSSRIWMNTIASYCMAFWSKLRARLLAALPMNRRSATTTPAA